MDSKKKVVLQVLNLVTLIITVIINYTATLFGLGGYSTGELSDSIPNLFVPAGITFTIWAVIYLFLGIFVVYQARDLFKKEKIDMPYLEKISFWFILSNLANTAWIFLWHFQYEVDIFIYLSLVAMLVIFLSLLMIYLRLRVGKEKVSAREKWFVHVPFSIYIGWITVATIANVTAVLVRSGIPDSGLVPEILTVVVIAVAVLITILMLLTRTDYAYSLVIVWAIFGIFLKQFDSNLTVAITALVAVIIVLVGIIFIAIKKSRK